MITLITAVQVTLKIEDPAGATKEVSAPLGSHKPARIAKVFPYLPYLAKSTRIGNVRSGLFQSRNTFRCVTLLEENLLKWSFPPVDPLVSRLNKKTMTPVEGLSFQEPRRQEGRSDCSVYVFDSRLGPLLATALVSQMLTEWAKLLHCDLGNEQVPPVYVVLVDQLVQGLK